MDLQLRGKTAVVIGGDAGCFEGLGRGAAEALVDEGVAVALIASSQAPQDKAEIKARGRRTIEIAGDLAQWPSLERAIQEARRELGPIDILINNSGGPPAGPVLKISPESWEEHFRSYVFSFIRATELLLPEMRQRRFGRILFISSQSVVEPLPLVAVSNTVRPALAGWAKNLAAEVGRDGVTVNTFVPGAFAGNGRRIDEEFSAKYVYNNPVGRYGTPAEFGAVVAFLASPRAAFITGSMIRVDGGSTHTLI